jgi:NAD(P)-dependent dehydrogenase (short-subunit alcohol dehydrogenase family)
MEASIRLDGRTAVVTGAGRGLGSAYADALAAAGAAVVVNDVDEDAARATAARITAAGGAAVAQAGAVGGAEVADALVARAVAEFGALDIMVCNAGVLRDRMLWRMSDEEFDLVIATHLRGTFTCARAAAVHMRERGEGGRILVVGSPAGQRGNLGQTNYSAAKAGIVAFARTWAMELARARITVNAVVPVAFTAMVATMPAYAEHAERIAAGEPVPRELRQGHGLGLAQDAAPLVVFLASAAAEGITGQAVGIGGDRLSMWSHPTEAVTALRDGGWTPEAIAQMWPTTLGPTEQTVGVVLPAAPERGARPPGPPTR